MFDVVSLEVVSAVFDVVSLEVVSAVFDVVSLEVVSAVFDVVVDSVAVWASPFRCFPMLGESPSLWKKLLPHMPVLPLHLWFERLLPDGVGGGGHQLLG